MNFDLTEDQLALRDGIRSLVTGRFPIERVRRGFDRSVYDELAEAGVFSLVEDGFSMADATIVFEELGRGAVPGPLVASFGRAGVATAVDAGLPGGAWVEFLGVADEVVVYDGPDSGRVVAAGGLAAGEPDAWPLDPLTPVWRVAELPAAGEPLADAADWWRRAAVLTAAYCVGLSDRVTEMAVEFAQERRQFDRPIASFQAVKHICADMAVRSELARVSSQAAACLIDDSEVDDVERAVSGAKLLAAEAAVLNGRAAIQVHGGMGFTWEVDVHLYLKRAWVLETHFGGTDLHADRVAAGAVR